MSLISKNKKIDLYYLRREVTKLSTQIVDHGIDELSDDNLIQIKAMRDHLSAILELNPNKSIFMGTYPEEKKPFGANHG